MIRLVINHYASPYPQRNVELNNTLERNCANPLIDAICCVGQSPPTTTHPKLIYVPSPIRPTFAELFALCNERTGRDDLNVIANADIYFDETLANAERLTGKQCYALLRYESDGQHPRYSMEQGQAVENNSQDVWMFRGAINCPDANFSMGTRRCDNVLAHLLNEAGYDLKNPCKSIHCHHNHDCGYRTYHKTRVVPGLMREVPPSNG